MPVFLGLLATTSAGTTYLGAAWLRSRREAGPAPRIGAAYLFHESGEPLAAVALGRGDSAGQDRPEPVLDAIGAFLARNLRRGPTIEVTELRFDGQGVIAVRGRYVIAAALHDGSTNEEVRRQLVTFVRAFEGRRQKELSMWARASHCAEEASVDLSRSVLRPPSASPG